MRMAWIAPRIQKGTGPDEERSRTDIVLVVDGKIFDLKRIQIPEGVPIIDRRVRK